MKAKIKKYIFFAAVIAGMAWFVFAWLDKKFEWSRAMSNDYRTHQGSAPFLNITFRYPTHWRLVQDEGKIEAYQQVMLVGPRNGDDTYSASIVLRGSPLKKNRGRFENVIQLKQNYISHIYMEPHVVNDSTAKLEERLAEDYTVTYTVPPLLGSHAKFMKVPVKERAVFAQSGDCLYELIFSADEREFDRHKSEFEYLLKTLHFKDLS